MGNKVTFDYSKVSGFVKDTEVESMKKIVAAAKEELVSRNGAGNDFLGWIDLPVRIMIKKSSQEFKKAAEKIQERQRGTGSNRYRRFLSWSKSGH